MKKAQVLMNKSLCFGLSILKISKIVMHKFWYDKVKPKKGEKAKLCYTDIDSFIAYIKEKTFTQTWQNMLEQDLVLQIMN